MKRITYVLLATMLLAASFAAEALTVADAERETAAQGTKAALVCVA